MTDESKQYQKETDKGSYYNPETWIEEFEQNNVFYHDNEYSSGESEDTDSCEGIDGNERPSYESVNLRDKTYVIISPETLKNVLQQVAICEVCYSDLLLDDSLSGSYGLGRCWSLGCANKNCSNYT